MPERNCLACTDRQKITRGCDTDAKEITTIDGDALTRCPRRPLLDKPQRFGYLFWLYRQKEKGYLPERGGLNDQPAKYLAYMGIIDRALDFCTSEKQKKEERQRRRDAALKGRGR